MILTNFLFAVAIILCVTIFLIGVYFTAELIPELNIGKFDVTDNSEEWVLVKKISTILHILIAFGMFVSMVAHIRETSYVPESIYENEFTQEESQL